MSWLGGMNGRDRLLLAFIGVCAVVVIVVVAVFGPARETSTVPTTYSNAPAGARAAYLLLKRTGYDVTRSTGPLKSIAGKTTPDTTYIFADPYYSQAQDASTEVKDILARGGRVLLTGITGAMLLGDKRPPVTPMAFDVPCDAQPEGLSALASSGQVRMVAEAAWKVSGPEQRVVYRCGKDPVIVTFPMGKGEVVWWSSPSPLENGTIAQAHNMDLLLESIGPRSTTKVVWDESLHGAGQSLLSWTTGTVLPYVWWQFALAALLLILSFSRRRGPLRPDPVVIRAKPLEFAQSLGSLYRKAGAANVAAVVAYQNFRLKLEKKSGISMQATGTEAAAAILRRYPGKTAAAKVVEAAAAASEDTRMREQDALKLVQSLRDAENELI